MSTRVVRLDSSTEVQTVRWRRVGTPGPEPEPAEGTPAAGNRPDAGFERRLAEMQAEAAARADQAYQRGLREGEARGAAQAAAGYEAALERAVRSVQELAGSRDQFRREAEEDVVRLAIAIAARILHREIQTDPEALLGLVNAAMRKLSLREVHRVRTHPQDAEAIRRQLERSGSPIAVEVQPDASLARGSLVVETLRGSMDASVDTQLREIERGFVDLVHRRA